MGDPPTLTDVSESRKQEHEEFRYDVVVSYNRRRGSCCRTHRAAATGRGPEGVLRPLVHDRGPVVAGRDPRGDPGGGRLCGRHWARRPRGLGARGTRRGAVTGSEGPALPALHGASRGRAESHGSPAGLSWDPQLGGSRVGRRRWNRVRPADDRRHGRSATPGGGVAHRGCALSLPGPGGVRRAARQLVLRSPGRHASPVRAAQRAPLRRRARSVGQREDLDREGGTGSRTPQPSAFAQRGVDDPDDDAGRQPARRTHGADRTPRSARVDAAHPRCALGGRAHPRSGRRAGARGPTHT